MTITRTDFKINLAISVKSYTDKPQSNEFTKCLYQYQELDKDGLIDVIRNGKIMCHNFRIEKWNDNGCFKRYQNQRKENFEFANVLFVDIDDIEIGLTDLIRLLDKKPTVAYTTFSNGVKGNRYRLVYCLENKITSADEYERVMKSLNCYIKQTFPSFQIDEHSFVSTQPMYGTKKNCKLHDNPYVYSKNDFLPYYCKETETENVKKAIKTGTENVKYEFKVNDWDFVNSFFKLDLYDKISVPLFIRKWGYKYPYFYQTEIHFKWNEMAALLPDNPADFQCIQRKYFKDIHEISEESEDKRFFGCHIQKVKNGSRNKLMYVLCQLRKVMKPDVAPEHLLYCLLYDVFFTFDISDKEITNTKLYNTAFRAYQDEITIELKKDKRKFIVNPDYCLINGITKKSVARKFQRELNDAKIGEHYDFGVSVKENYRILNEKEIKVSMSTLYRFKRSYEGDIIDTDTPNEKSTKHNSPNELEGMFMNDAPLSKRNEVVLSNENASSDEVSNQPEKVSENVLKQDNTESPQTSIEGMKQKTFEKINETYNRLVKDGTKPSARLLAKASHTSQDNSRKYLKFISGAPQ